MRDLTPALNLIKEFEGCVLHTYTDVVGVNTIGWGCADPAQAIPGRVITQAEADQLLADDIAKFSAQVQAVLIMPCTNNQLCALTSMAFNVGIGALKGSTLLQRFNAGWANEMVANQFSLWVHAGGHVLSGLVRRREAERELFLKA